MLSSGMRRDDGANDGPNDGVIVSAERRLYSRSAPHERGSLDEERAPPQRSGAACDLCDSLPLSWFGY